MASRFVQLACLCCMLLLGTASPAVAENRPNVVFILADDLGWGEVGCFGQEKIKTPNIDRLAREGVRLTRHYAGAPVCAPSRCVLMTGRHLGHAEIRGNRQAAKSFPEYREGQHPISAEAVTMGEVFRQAGYATAAMGKWGLGPVGSSGDPNEQGFELFFGYNCQAVAHSFYPRYLWKNAERIEINRKAIPGHRRQAEGNVTMAAWIGETYASHAIRDEARRFIRDHADRPFFLFLPLTEPHVAMHPPAAAVQAYPEDWDPRPYRGQCGYLPHPRPRAGYAAMISELDRHVGVVVEALREAGVLDNTLIVFTSDNGTTHRGQDDQFGIGGVDADFFNSTGGLRGFKGSVYEGGLRVPTIVRWPRHIAAGTTDETPGYFADWLPTLCVAAGVDGPPAIDGENLWPSITGQGRVARERPMVWAFAGYGGQVAVRLQHHKVLRRNLLRKQPGRWEVYDLRADPGETINLAAQRPALIEAAKRVLREEVDDNATFPIPLPTD